MEARASWGASLVFPSPIQSGARVHAAGTSSARAVCRTSRGRNPKPAARWPGQYCHCGNSMSRYCSEGGLLMPEHWHDDDPDVVMGFVALFTILVLAILLIAYFSWYRP